MSTACVSSPIQWMTVTACLASCTTCTSRSPASSRTIWRFPRRMAISHCIPACLDRMAYRSRSRFAPTRWNVSPIPELPRIGCIRKARKTAMKPHRRGRWNGSRVCWKCSSVPVVRWSSWKVSRSTCFRMKFMSSPRRGTLKNCHVVPRWWILPTPCIPISEIPVWLRASITACRH